MARVVLPRPAAQVPVHGAAVLPNEHGRDGGLGIYRKGDKPPGDKVRERGLQAAATPVPRGCTSQGPPSGTARLGQWDQSLTRDCGSPQAALRLGGWGDNERGLQKPGDQLTTVGEDAGQEGLEGPQVPARGTRGRSGSDPRVAGAESPRQRLSEAGRLGGRRGPAESPRGAGSLGRRTASVAGPTEAMAPGQAGS